MNVIALNRSIAAMALAWGLAAAPAPAQEFPWSLALGYAPTRLRPANGTDVVLNGEALTAQCDLDRTWSLEAQVSHQTGTEAGQVDLRQDGFQLGGKYRFPASGRWQPYGHLLTGWGRLHAADGGASDQASTWVFSPAAGLECALSQRLALRGQVDLHITHYRGVYQRSPGVTFALAYRF